MGHLSWHGPPGDSRRGRGRVAAETSSHEQSDVYSDMLLA